MKNDFKRSKVLISHFVTRSNQVYFVYVLSQPNWRMCVMIFKENESDEKRGRTGIESNHCANRPLPFGTPTLSGFIFRGAQIPSPPVPSRSSSTQSLPRRGAARCVLRAVYRRTSLMFADRRERWMQQQWKQRGKKVFYLITDERLILVSY